jgi:hypothetical protein
LALSEQVEIDGLVHHAIVDGIMRSGAAPSNEDLARSLKLSPADTEASLKRLEENHGVVFHPNSCRPSVIHPFSLSPTATWVQKGKDGWWSPCMWCALGAAVLLGGTVTIHSRFGGEIEDLDLEVRDGNPTRNDVLIHVAIPPRDAWVDVHHFCATLLPFKTEADVDSWARRHGLPRGKAVPVEVIARLARKWYGKHADKDWRKWTAAEAKQIFKDVGLVGEFWNLEASTGRF